LYFKGFDVDEATTVEKIEELEGELRVYFAKFGEVKNLKLVRKPEQLQKDAITESLLIGFGFVSF